MMELVKPLLHQESILEKLKEDREIEHDNESQNY